MTGSIAAKARNGVLKTEKELTRPVYGQRRYMANNAS